MACKEHKEIEEKLKILDKETQVLKNIIDNKQKIIELKDEEIKNKNEISASHQKLVGTLQNKISKLELENNHLKNPVDSYRKHGGL